MKSKAPTQPKRPRDINQLAKYIVELSTGEFDEQPQEEPPKITKHVKKKKKGND